MAGQVRQTAGLSPRAVLCGVIGAPPVQSAELSGRLIEGQSKAECRSSGTFDQLPGQHCPLLDAADHFALHRPVLQEWNPEEAVEEGEEELEEDLELQSNADGVDVDPSEEPHDEL